MPVFSIRAALSLLAIGGWLGLATQSFAWLPPPDYTNAMVFYKEDAATIDGKNSLKTIEMFVARAKGEYDGPIYLSGNSESSETNAVELSKTRVETVKAKLIELGIPPSRISVKWYGDNHPLVPTSAGVKDAQNRFVEMVAIRLCSPNCPEPKFQDAGHG